MILLTYVSMSYNVLIINELQDHTSFERFAKKNPTHLREGLHSCLLRINYYFLAAVLAGAGFKMSFAFTATVGAVAGAFASDFLTAGLKYFTTSFH